MTRFDKLMTEYKKLYTEALELESKFFSGSDAVINECLHDVFNESEVLWAQITDEMAKVEDEYRLEEYVS